MSFVLSIPVRCVEPTGHGPDLPSAVVEFLKQLEQVKVIWRDAPEWAQRLFTEGGRRIIMVDSPHGSTDYWYLNSDLKPLQWLNHQDIEGYATKLLAAKSVIDTVATFAGSTSIQLLEHIPVPLFYWQPNFPLGVSPTIN